MIEEMRAVGMLSEKKGAHLFEIPKPRIKEENEVLVRVLQSGTCGTDRSIIKHDAKDVALGSDRIVLGHEGFGVVEKVGGEVKDFKAGDYVVPTVRRGCGECFPCLHNQSDMCYTGRYKERGLHKLDGFFTPYIVDEEQYLVKVPAELKGIAVLAEPASIVEKAIDQIRHIQSRLPWSCDHPEHSYERDAWGFCKTAVVIGAGPIGFMATAMLRLAGVEVFVVEIVPEDNIKIELIKELGAKYIDGKGKQNTEIITPQMEVDIMFEASGASELALNLIPLMSRNSIIVLTGIARGEYNLRFDVNLLLRQIVRFNQVIVGSVNGNRTHFEKGLQDMKKIQKKYPSVLERAITHRMPLGEYERAVFNPDENQVKVVFDFEKYPEEAIK